MHHKRGFAEEFPAGYTECKGSQFSTLSKGHNVAKIAFRLGSGGRIFIRFPTYDAELVATVKTLPGRQWHVETKEWSVDWEPQSILKLLTLFGTADVELSPELLPPISEVTRRDLLDYLLTFPGRYHGRLDLLPFLSRVWDLSKLPSTDSRFQDASGDIWQHMVNNSDWDDDYLLFSYLDLLHCDVKVLLTFMEQCVHPLVRRTQEEATAIVSALNDMLPVDGYQLEVHRHISGRPVYVCKPAIHGEAQGKKPSQPYDVVLSYAGEDQAYVEQVAHCLDDAKVHFFFAPFKEVEMWGKDLTEYLDMIYGGNAKFCVMFISEHYARKAWPTHEKRSALAAAVERKQEYILPARFDGTEVPGLRSSTVYVDLNQKTPEELANLIAKKLRASGR